MNNGSCSDKMYMLIFLYTHRHTQMHAPFPPVIYLGGTITVSIRMDMIVNNDGGRGKAKTKGEKHTNSRDGTALVQQALHSPQPSLTSTISTYAALDVFLPETGIRYANKYVVAPKIGSKEITLEVYGDDADAKNILGWTNINLKRPRTIRFQVRERNTEKEEQDNSYTHGTIDLTYTCSFKLIHV